jgi:hypothetical protein
MQLLCLDIHCIGIYDLLHSKRYSSQQRLLARKKHAQREKEHQLPYCPTVKTGTAEAKTENWKSSISFILHPPCALFLFVCLWSLAPLPHQPNPAGHKKLFGKAFHLLPFLAFGRCVQERA